MGLIAGALGLTIGFGAGYMVHSQTVETVAPITISRAAGPVDANGVTARTAGAPDRVNVADTTDRSRT